MSNEFLMDILEAIKQRKSIRDLEHSVVGWPTESVYRRRQVELAKKLFQLMDIKREDVDKRSQWLERGFKHF